MPQKHGTPGMLQTRELEIGLSSLVKDSNLIVKVRFVKLFKESLPVVDKQQDQAIIIPPFIKQGCVFEVLAVLKNTSRTEIPDKINVPNENWRRLLGRHKEKFAGGIAKTYTVPLYISDVPSLRKATILFLNYFQGMFDLAAKDAFEDGTAEEKVAMILGN
jgi:hypothetical protein